MKHRIFLLLIICFSLFCVVNAQYQHPQGRFIEVNRIKLWIEMDGKGEPLFLIAGGPGYSHLYLHSFDALKDSSLLVFVDYYGRGKSDTATEAKNYSIEKDVEEVEGVRKALGFDKINLLGHSFGSVVTQLYAIKYGEHVSHLIIADGLYSGKMYQEIDDNANHIISESQPELWDSIMLLRKKGYISSNPLHYNLYFKFLPGLLFFYNPENATKLPQDTAYPNDFNFIYYYQLTGSDGDFVIGPDLAKYDVTTQLKDLKMPVLIINGRYDKACTPKSSIKYKEYCPQAQFVIFDNSGHFPQVEEPEKEFTVIKEFLRR